ncbi:MAG: hypothetical protein RMI93_00295 [Caldimicrobium sp.]|nr:hypothetical protein [Caldimicrobium sp.]MDW8182033.1 hypothetical protein [Caldimicrobium sp.]
MGKEVLWEKLLKEGLEIFRVFEDCLGIEIIGLKISHRGSIREIC